MKPDLVASYEGSILHITFFLSRRFLFLFLFLQRKDINTSGAKRHQGWQRSDVYVDVSQVSCCLLNSLYSVLCQRVLSEETCSPELILTSRDVVGTVEMNKPLGESDPFLPSLWWHVSHGHETLEILKGDMSTWTEKKFLIKKLMKEQRNSIEKGKEIQEKNRYSKKKLNSVHKVK